MLREADDFCHRARNFLRAIPILRSQRATLAGWEYLSAGPPCGSGLAPAAGSDFARLVPAQCQCALPVPGCCWEVRSLPDRSILWLRTWRSSKEIRRERTVVNDNPSIIPTNVRRRSPTTRKIALDGYNVRDDERQAGVAETLRQAPLFFGRHRDEVPDRACGSTPVCARGTALLRRRCLRRSLHCGKWPGADF
jgi:hypothetical protein